MCAMGPALVVELPPAFDEHLGLGATAEPFPVQQFVTQLAVEALDEPVLQRTAWRDEGRTDRSISQPAHDLGSGKSGAVVRPNERGLAVQAQPSLRSKKSIFQRDSEEQIVARFMTEELPLHGIRSAHECSDCLHGYDQGEYLENSGWNHTRFFFPQAYEAGLRLAREGNALWEAFDDAHKRAQLAGELEIPMEFFTRTVQFILHYYARHDCILARLFKRASPRSRSVNSVSVQSGASRAKAFTQKARVNATRRKFASPARSHCSTTASSGLQLRRPGLCIRR